VLRQGPVPFQRGAHTRGGGPPRRASARTGPNASTGALYLSSEQRQKLRPAFERHSKAFHALHRKALPEHRALNNELDAEILPVLSPEQVEKFQEMQEVQGTFLRGWAGESPERAPRP